MHYSDEINASLMICGVWIKSTFREVRFKKNMNKCQCVGSQTVSLLYKCHNNGEITKLIIQREAVVQDECLFEWSIIWGAA